MKNLIKVAYILLSRLTYLEIKPQGSYQPISLLKKIMLKAQNLKFIVTLMHLVSNIHSFLHEPSIKEAFFVVSSILGLIKEINETPIRDWVTELATKLYKSNNLDL